AIMPHANTDRGETAMRNSLQGTCVATGDCHPNPRAGNDIGVFLERFLNRRKFLVAATMPFVAEVGSALVPGSSANAAPDDDGTPFAPDTVRALARDLAQKDFKAPDGNLPDEFKKLDYDQYRAIRFRPDRALWKDEHLSFQAQFFHRGFYYTNRIDMFQVVQGRAIPIRDTSDMFDFGKLQPPPPNLDLGFAGFRLHAPMNRPDYYDEVCVFLGASYFRAVAKGQIYGMSSRGLSINTADTKG